MQVRVRAWPPLIVYHIVWTRRRRRKALFYISRMLTGLLAETRKMRMELNKLAER